MRKSRQCWDRLSLRINPPDYVECGISVNVSIRTFLEFNRTHVGFPSGTAA